MGYSPRYRVGGTNLQRLMETINDHKIFISIAEIREFRINASIIFINAVNSNRRKAKILLQFLMIPHTYSGVRIVAFWNSARYKMRNRAFYDFISRYFRDMSSKFYEPKGNYAPCILISRNGPFFRRCGRKSER